ncbi:MAG: hypothetical protein ACFFDH_23490 [Promethearchaeota archaeon]
MIVNEQLTCSPVGKGIVTDLNNFLLADLNLSRKGKIENIEFLSGTLKDHGYSKMIHISSSSLWKRINNKKIFDRLVKKKEIWKAPALVDTDWYILTIAQQFDYDILSNDKFREYWDEFGRDWIEYKRKTFMFIEDKIIIKF